MSRYHDSRYAIRAPLGIFSRSSYIGWMEMTTLFDLIRPMHITTPEYCRAISLAIVRLKFRSTGSFCLASYVGIAMAIATVSFGCSISGVCVAHGQLGEPCGGSVTEESRYCAQGFECTCRGANYTDCICYEIRLEREPCDVPNTVCEQNTECRTGVCVSTGLQGTFEQACLDG